MSKDFTHSEKLIALYDKKRRYFFFTKIVPLLRIGYSLPQISKTLKGDIGTIRLYLKKFGSEFDKSNSKRNKNYVYKNTSERVIKSKEGYTILYPKILKLIDEGYTSTEIGKTLNRDRSIAKKLLRINDNSAYLHKLFKNGKRKQILTAQKRAKNSKSAKGLKDYQLKRINEKKKYFPLIERLIKQGYHIQQISDFFNKRNISLSYIAVKNMIRYHATSAIAKKIKINGMISMNKAIFGDGKEICKKRTSKDEIRFRDVIRQHIPDAVWQYEIKTQNSTYYMDIALPQHKIAFEYDGSYWHERNKDKDDRKDKNLSEIGWKVIRFVFKRSCSHNVLNKRFLERIKELDLEHLIQ